MCLRVQDKNFETDAEGNVIREGGSWTAPEFVVPDLTGFALGAYVTRTKETNANA